MESDHDGGGDFFKDVVADFLQLFSLHQEADIEGIGQALNLKWGLGIGAKHVLEFLTSKSKTENSFGVCGDIGLVLFLDFLNEMIDDELINGASSNVAVEGGGFDISLFLGEGGNGDSHGGMTNVDEDNIPGIFLGEFRDTGDSISKGGGGGLIDQTHTVEVGDLSGGEDGMSLAICVVGGD